MRRQAVGGHTAVLFPSAEERPYSMMGGQSSTVWHDRWGWGHSLSYSFIQLYFRRELDINGWEDLSGIASMTGNILNLINDITSTWKIDSSNIYLGNILLVLGIMTTGFTLTCYCRWV